MSEEERKIVEDSRKLDSVRKTVKITPVSSIETRYLLRRRYSENSSESRS